ncbi:RNA polymerase sigma factor [Thalassoroseus pseudoceratinae]|uniref:RNA polymerase sigma factor n=1 Tax=Thalassoroseus pseudoceratinae TaxID=2713176 RepID=UPI00141F5A27|nr:sigma-70 family RNA polymerase sigma factor [Thalassoroseus pseudoceratinae]
MHQRPSAVPSTVTDLTSLSLLGRVKANDEDAWRELVRVYGPLVWSWCRRRGLSKIDAADVAQNIFTSVFVALPKFRRDQEGQTFRGWLRTISRNAIHDFYRQSTKELDGVGGSTALGRLHALPSNDESARPADLAVEQTHQCDERVLILREVLRLLEQRFAPQTWTAFQRTAIGCASAEDVALDQGMTVAAVRQAKYRVLRCLRNEYREILEPEIEPSSSCTVDRHSAGNVSTGNH